jgi:hypothetical protein
VEGNASPLITHLIGAEVCMSRQRGFYHKCHRCMYRGKAASWEPAPEQLAAARALESAAAAGSLPHPKA